MRVSTRWFLCGVIFILSNLVTVCQCAAQPWPGDSLIAEYTLLMTEYSYVETAALELNGVYYLQVTGNYGIAHGWSWMDAAYCWGICDPPLASDIYGNGNSTCCWSWNDETVRPSPDMYNPDHVYYYPFVSGGTPESFSYSDPGSYWDNSGDLNIQLWKRPINTCPLTAIPFFEPFDNGGLDTCWQWIREDTNRWDVNERPGWMSLTPYGSLYGPSGNDGKNILLRSLPDHNFVIETKLEHAAAYGTGAGLIVYLDDDNFINADYMDHGDTGGPVVRSHSEQDGNYTSVDLSIESTTVYLRISKIGSQYTVYASSDSIDWNLITSWQRDLTAYGLVRAGVFATAWSSNFPVADFDYFLVGPPPTLIVSPLQVDYGLQDIGADSMTTVNLFNPGSMPSTIIVIGCASDAFQIDTTGLSGQISSDSTFAAHVAFVPATPGTYDDVLTIIAHRDVTDTFVVDLHAEAAFIPVAPESLVVKRGTGHNVELNWAPVTHTISGQPYIPTYYVVYGATEPFGPFIPIGSSESASFTHSGILFTQERYFYQVTAYGGSTLRE